MKTSFTLTGLPEIVVLTAPFGGDVAQHGAITIRDRHYINFVLLPQRQFLVHAVAPEIPDCAVRALGRLIFLHQGGTEHDLWPAGETPRVKSWPPTKNQGCDGKQIASCWEIGTGDASARLDILDDKQWAAAKVQFGPGPTELLLREVAATVLSHWTLLPTSEA